LWSNVLLALAVFSDHMASASSPVLRMKLLDTTEFVTPVWKFRPSAIWSDDDVVGDAQVVHGPSNHMPTLVWWM
jgi:hypothetical protein